VDKIPKIIASVSLLLFLLVPLVYCYQIVDVYCPKCQKLLYHLTFEGKLLTTWIKPDNIEAVKDIPYFLKGDRFICPFDSAPLNGWEYWFWERDLDSPAFPYPALTVWTKVDGEFRFWPDEVNLEE